MLSQVIQNCIHIRNVGAVAIGCWIDGVISMVDETLGHATALIRSLPQWALTPAWAAGEGHLPLIDQNRYRRLRPAIAPHFGGQWRQG